MIRIKKNNINTSLYEEINKGFTDKKLIMFTTCHKCKKQNDYWESRPLKEPITLNGKVLSGAFGATKYFCPISERKVRNGTSSETKERFIITDCLNGDREEIREKVSSIRKLNKTVDDPTKKVTDSII